jgi:hypothetical protein
MIRRKVQIILKVMPNNRESTRTLVEVDNVKENISIEKDLVVFLILYLKLQ